MSPVDPRVHDGEPMYGSGEPHWRDDGDGSCSYCGSIGVPEAIRRLRTPGVHFSGTDKTTYKVYIELPGYVNTRDSGSNKFYTRHLRACTLAELAEFDALSRKIFGLAFDFHENDLRCRYPRSSSFYGFQTFGDIGPDGEPVFGDGSPKAPGPEFWS